MPGCAGLTLCRGPGRIEGRRDGAIRTWNSARLVPVHILAPGRQFEKQGRKPGSFIVQAEAAADRYVVMGILRQ